MADANFNRKSVKELQNYLKERGVTFSDLWKAELVQGMTILIKCQQIIIYVKNGKRW
jgi:hypothetical protein